MLATRPAPPISLVFWFQHEITYSFEICHVSAFTFPLRGLALVLQCPAPDRRGLTGYSMVPTASSHAFVHVLLRGELITTPTPPRRRTWWTAWPGARNTCRARPAADMPWISGSHRDSCEPETLRGEARRSPSRSIQSLCTSTNK